MIGGLVDWWIGGLVEWKLAAWGSEALQVTSSTRDRDGSADHVSWRLWEVHLYVFYVSGRFLGEPDFPGLRARVGPLPESLRPMLARLIFTYFTSLGGVGRFICKYFTCLGGS